MKFLPVILSASILLSPLTVVAKTPRKETPGQTYCRKVSSGNRYARRLCNQPWLGTGWLIDQINKPRKRKN
ncbi:MAG: hypothetical protein KME64_03925 [Scytonematopsis contorta HA4267-MV1]|jgi:hypothetical protein|nr:hypothetical protein [Scytonematopsis contorta HA4267-MV1]